MNGGKCVSDLKRGTNKSPPIPMIKTEYLTGFEISDNLGGFFTLPPDRFCFIIKVAIIRGMVRLTKLGRKSL
jgi:hypothetical protein